MMLLQAHFQKEERHLLEKELIFGTMTQNRVMSILMKSGVLERIHTLSLLETGIVMYTSLQKTEKLM